MLRGQDILSDDSTLHEHGITDGDTLNIIIGPKKQVTIDVTCGPRTFQHKVNNTMTVKELKGLLIERKQVAFLYSDFDIAYNAGKGREKVVLADESLPLHHFGIEKESHLHVEMPFLILQIENQQGYRLSKQFSRKTTIPELKETIMKYRNDKYLFNVSMFVSTGDGEYKRLHESTEKSVGEMLTSNDIIYYIEDRFYDGQSYPIWNQDTEIARVYFIMNTDTIRTVKLRIQDQLGIPTSSMSVTDHTRVKDKYLPFPQNKWTYRSNVRFTHDSDKINNQCKIILKESE